jgi:hypothetical protein
MTREFIVGDKRDRALGVTLLPDGNYAEHVWGSLSNRMQSALQAAVKHPEHCAVGESRTLEALARRGLVKPLLARQRLRLAPGGELTEQGVALVEWMIWATQQPGQQTSVTETEESRVAPVQREQ